MSKKDYKINITPKEITKKVTFSLYPEQVTKLELIEEKLNIKGGKSALIRGFIDDVYNQMFDEE